MGDSYDDAAKKLGQIGEALHGITDAQLLELGHAMMNIIVLRTKTGLDADRKPFAPYSEAYKKVRIDHSLQVDHVDLARTGHMIQSLIVSPGAGEVVIGFGSTREATKAAAHNSGVNRSPSWLRNAYRKVRGKRKLLGRRLPKRNWFDVRAPEETAALTEMVGVDVTQNVEKVVNGR